MEILKFPLGQLQANCYLLIKNNKCLIVDPGDAADFILETVLRKNLNPKAILATHGHFDHIMAVGEIQLNYPIPLFLKDEDIFLVNRLKETAEHFLEHKPVVIEPQNIYSFQSEQFASISEAWNIVVIDTPGHTPGSCCFYLPQDKVLLTGDTLFKDAIGRTNFAYGKPLELERSLQKLFALEGIITVNPGHGEETLLHIEKDKVR